MLGAALSIGVLLALASGRATQGCVAPQSLVSKMVQQLEDSVKVNEEPNPSVLLALNLAGATESYSHKWLLHEIREKAVERAQKEMSSGEVALYVLALLSSCADPRHVHALGHSVDLVSILQEKTDEEMAKLEVDGVPETTLFGVSLDTLALCLEGAGGYQEASVLLAKRLLSPESHLSVDTRAVAALALVCTYDRTELHDVRDLLWEALATVTNAFLDEQEESGGVIGNIYSMGLALQALGSTGKFYAPRPWDCAQAFSVVYGHDYRQPTAIAQVLPALLGRSYLHAADPDCAAGRSVSPRPQLSPSPKLPTVGVPSATTITVTYSIVNQLQGQPFSFTVAVEVPPGSTLLDVMEAAKEKDPHAFSFVTTDTSWGPFVVSIHGLAGDNGDRTYWRFLSGTKPLPEGVGTYTPHDREHIQAVFSQY